MNPRPLLVLLASTALVLALSACGGGSNSASTGAATTAAGGGGGGGQTLQLAADPGGALKFDQTSLEASAGKVTIDFTNDSSLSHNVTIDGPGVEDEGTDTIKGSTANITLDLKPGKYTFYCSVDGHRAAGMEGTLVVK
jgi:plastocyanin